MFGKFKKYFSEICTIAAPIIVGNLGHTLTGAVDVFVAAKYSIDALAAIAIANSIFFTVSFLGIGFLIAISIVLSNYRGAKMHTKRYFSSGGNFVTSFGIDNLGAFGWNYLFYTTFRVSRGTC